MRGVILTVEGEPDVALPTAKVIRQVVGRMTPDGGPGYAVLAGPGSDYAQVAGGDGVFTVEWREYKGDEFQHWKAGLTEGDPDGEVVVPGNGIEITVRGNERLAAADTIAILSAYLAGKGRPKQFAWRDMTEMFAE